MNIARLKVQLDVRRKSTWTSSVSKFGAAANKNKNNKNKKMKNLTSVNPAILTQELSGPEAWAARAAKRLIPEACVASAHVNGFCLFGCLG